MIKLLVVFLGGGIGSALRYGVQELMHEHIAVYRFPWSTLTVNVVGCFLIGLFYALSARLNWSADLRLLLTAGLCGGFTTFSTFSNDCLLMLRECAMFPTVLYIVASVCLGIGACRLGAYIAG